MLNIIFHAEQQSELMQTSTQLKKHNHYHHPDHKNTYCTTNTESKNGGKVKFVYIVEVYRCQGHCLYGGMIRIVLVSGMSVWKNRILNTQLDKRVLKINCKEISIRA